MPPSALSPPSMPVKIPFHFSCASPVKLRLIHPIVTFVFVTCSWSVASGIVVTILLLGLPKSVSSHVFPLHQFCREPFVGAMIAVITTRPKESASPTTAGTKQSPINSLILKSSSWSQRRSFPATK